MSVTIGTRDGLVPLYAGTAPTVPGVQQVNIAIPEGVSGDAALTICAAMGEQHFCSASYSLAVQ